MTANPPSSTRKNPQSNRQQRRSLFHPAWLLVIIGLLIPFHLISCTSAQSSDPISIVQTLNERANKGDIDGAMEFYAEDAVSSWEYGRVGAQEIRESLEGDWEEKIRFEISNLRADGNEVTYTAKVYQGDQYINTVENGLYVFADGKIIFEGTVRSRIMECNKDTSQAFCP